MAFIKCPECGHTALSVASTCPNCGHLLVQNPMQHGPRLGTVSCRGCQKQIASTETVCPYCGHQIRRWHNIRIAAWSTGALLLAIGGFALFNVARNASRTPEAGVEPPAPPVTDPAPGAPAVTAPAPPPGPAAAAAAAATELAPQPRPTGTPTESLPTTEARWTANWVNVREAPGTASAIVGVLRPGTSVRVGQFRRGWWAVYTDGELLGWAAGNLLVSTRPDTLP